MSMTRNISMAIALAGLLAGASEARASTLIYVNDGATGNIWEYDSGNVNHEVLVGTIGQQYEIEYAPGQFYSFFSGAFSISSGPAANTLYVTAANLTATLLYTLNLSNGTITEIGGNVGGNALGEGRDGWLYVGSGADLIRVNPATGATVLVGTGTEFYAGDLAVDPTNIEHMYGAVGMYNEDFSEYDVALVRVDRNTGAQTFIGSFGLPNQSSIFGLGFDLDGTLFATGPTEASMSSIYTVNKSTGAATVFRTMNYSAYDMATQPFTFQEPEIENPPEFQPPGTGAVPEPMTLGLAGLGAAAAAVRVRRA